MSPSPILDIAALEDALSEPTPAVVQSMSRLGGDLIVLGAGGKMGPTLARMAQRAFHEAGVAHRVIAVSRFGSPDAEKPFREHGIETIACDLLAPDAGDQLPDAPNVMFMVGMKFGATGQESLTWAMNSYVPAVASQRYAGSRIVAFSTGNVYPMTPVTSGGSVETDVPGPVGEYAMSCLGRERILEHFSRANGTPMAVLRLNYATELRYGVLVDLAEKVWSGEPVDVTTGVANVIWQGDANAMALLAFEHVSTPPVIFNIAGPEQLSVRKLAEQLGAAMGRRVEIIGEERDTALLSNGQRAHALFGYPRVPAAQLVAWTADWVARGGERSGKPTRFEVRDGQF